VTSRSCAALFKKFRKNGIVVLLLETVKFSINSLPINLRRVAKFQNKVGAETAEKVG